MKIRYLLPVAVLALASPAMAQGFSGPVITGDQMTSLPSMASNSIRYGDMLQPKGQFYASQARLERHVNVKQRLGRHMLRQSSFQRGAYNYGQEISNDKHCPVQTPLMGCES